MFLFPYDYRPDDTKSYDQLIIKNYNFQEKRSSQFYLVDLNYIFECDWLI